MGRKLAAILFDLGNVLVFHDNALLSRRFGELSGLSPDEVERRLAPLHDGINRGMWDAAGIRGAVGKALGVELGPPVFEEIFNSHFKLNEEIFPIIESLVGRVRLLVLSNTNPIHASFVLPRLPLLNKFDDLLLSHELGMVKPQRSIFETALVRAGTEPEDTAFFDDIPEYVRAAQELGIQGRVFKDVPGLKSDLRALGLDWSAPRDALEELRFALAHHVPSDAKEQADLAQMRRFAAVLEQPLARHQADAHFTASAVVIDPAGERVLLVHHRKLGRWLQPGGHCEVSDASLVATALREVKEETGLSAVLHPKASQPLDVDVHPIPGRGDEDEHLHLDVRFLVVAQNPEAVTAQEGEVSQAQWFGWAEALSRSEGELLRLLKKAKAYLALA